MSRWHGLAWWAAALPALPIALLLAVRTHRQALRLAPAAGPVSGRAGMGLEGDPLRLLVLGESTVAGVGASCLEYALAGRLAAELAERYRRPVHWLACGENGITAHEACERLLPRVLEEPVDLALLVFGVNDTTHLSPASQWRSALETMATSLAKRGARVAFSSVPPLQHFFALPWLLRRLLGARARLLDAQLREVAQASGTVYCPMTLEFVRGYLAVDGYHPSSLGYRVWAQGLAQLLSPVRVD
ncbi:SGNH/GDSL hydrolase family protein [Pseudomonas indica]|uniref:Lysophospholipase L1 n=1 Tax=Pseudomonas indica TaxID=137658 RepID=A0A1G9JCV6_9PSED|nr:SGNH/GDSL hydrolase family protein [Pseudomonas indica]SDL34954.1 Lysophospholipase L1 [Pseudomonas indica]